MDAKLYYKPSCPYCQKVLFYMEENEMELELVDISQDTKLREELIDIGGKGQVPCLVIDDDPLYESDDIIKWLGQNYEAE